MEKLVFFFILLAPLSLPILGQGFSISRYYSPEEYGGFQQVWETVQDTNQILYFGEGTGTSIYDGVKWKRYHIGEPGITRAFYKSDNGEVYLSSQYDFGILDNDSLNNFAFKSLSLGNESTFEGNYSAHLKTFKNGKNIYFFSKQGLEVWDGNTLSQFPFKNLESIAFTFQGNIFVSNIEGIYEFIDGLFYKVNGSEVFRGDKLNAATQLENGNILLGFGTAGLYEFDGVSFKEFNIKFNDEFADDFIFDITNINETLIAVSLISEGLVIIDQVGNLIEKYTSQKGFNYEGLLGLYLDHESNLWLNLWGGIEKLTLGVPIRHYDGKDGIDQEILGIHKIENQLFLAGKNKVFKSVYDSINKVNNFIEVTNKLIPELSIINDANDNMYFINNNDLYEINESGNEIILKEIALDFVEDLTGANQLIILGKDGVYTRKEKGWNKISLSHNLISREIVKAYNNIFVNKRSSIDVLRNGELVPISFSNDTTQIMRINKLNLINGELYVATEGPEVNAGLYRFDPTLEIFVKAKEFGLADEDLISKQITTFAQCDNGDVWFQNNISIKRAIKLEDGTWEVRTSPYQLIGGFDAVYTIECVGDEVWFGGTKGLYQLKNPDWDFKTDFKTNITGIFVNNDSLIYGGFGEPVNDIILPYTDNALRFTYAAASYINESKNSYSTKLEGFDKDWSSWSNETQKDYTNIPEGDYVFKVRSKNVFEVEGRMDSIPFNVLPPWYRTWWAYLGYLIGIVAILYTAYKIRINQILKVERMRNRIAGDLHDEVSATLTGISYFAEAVKRDPNPDKKEHFMTLITESAGDAKDKITDIVWSINPDNDNWELFLSKCRRFASDLLESKGLNYELKIVENIPGKFNMELRQQLWLIFKEMVTNAVRHSEASRLDIIMDVEGNKLKLVVQDDGIGFDVDTLKRGNGVTNIQKRATAIKAKIELDSSVGFGTRWKMILPLG